MFMHVTTTPFNRGKKGISEITQTLVILIAVLFLIGIVSYIIYTKIITGRLTPIE